MDTMVRENRNENAARNGQPAAQERFVAPMATVLENGDGYTLQVEMPGVNKEGLEMWVENNELTIIGRRSLPTVQGTLIHREIAPRKLPSRVRARSIDRRWQDQREDRAGRRHPDSAESGAGEAAQDHRLVSENASLLQKAASPPGLRPFFRELAFLLGALLNRLR